MKGLAEYTVDGIGGNGTKPASWHGTFNGYVPSDDRPRFSRKETKKSAIFIDFAKVAQMNAEHEAALARKADGGSYWTE